VRAALLNLFFPYFPGAFWAGKRKKNAKKLVDGKVQEICFDVQKSSEMVRSASKGHYDGTMIRSLFWGTYARTGTKGVQEQEFQACSMCRLGLSASPCGRG